MRQYESEAEALTGTEIRMSFSMPKHEHMRMRALIPWGIKSRFIRRLINIAMDRIETAPDRDKILGAILLGDYDPLTGDIKMR